MFPSTKSLTHQAILSYFIFIETQEWSVCIHSGCLRQSVKRHGYYVIRASSGRDFWVFKVCHFWIKNDFSISAFNTVRSLHVEKWLPLIPHSVFSKLVISAWDDYGNLVLCDLLFATVGRSCALISWQNWLREEFVSTELIGVLPTDSFSSKLL